MSRRHGIPALDWFRVIAAVLVIAIHTSPLMDWNETADFLLTRVLARLAVPFFFMVTGYFLARSNWRGTPRVWKKTAALYGAATLLYLPLNLYAGGYSPAQWVKLLLVDGTFYHLWYLPAVLLGILVVRPLVRLGLRPALMIAAVLYLLGLFGDSYYGLVSGIPAFKTLYDVLFLFSSYTRNGLFYAPLFLLLGAAGLKFRERIALPGLLLSLTAMTAEALLLRGMGVQRHDSMYLLLPVCMVFLFSLLTGVNRGENRTARTVSMLMYVLHPWCIVLIRAAAKALGARSWMVEQDFLHFLLVTAVTAAASVLLCRVRPVRCHRKARAWREVNLAALKHNVAALRGRMGAGSNLMAVVKADAYGHGMIPVARALQREGVRDYAVATCAEGVALRRAGIRGRILVLGYTAPEETPVLTRYRLTQTVVDEAHGLALARQGKRLHVHVALDTGMHRLGIPAGDMAAIRRVCREKLLVVDGIFSHLCVSDSLTEESIAFTQRQAQAFQQAVECLAAYGIRPKAVHLQASYGVLNGPPRQGSLCRVGIALYGVHSDAAPVKYALDLWPVLSLKARVASVRTLNEGETAGYGRAFRASRATVLATVTIGYADGLPRNLGERGAHVLLHGRRAPIVGLICMDQMLVDVTDVEEVRAGDVATLIGRDGGECIMAVELAERCGTITNELLSRLGSRLPVWISAGSGK